MFYSGNVFYSEIFKKRVKKSNHQSLVRLMLHVAAILISFFFCRYGTLFKNISGEAKPVTEEMIVPRL